MRMKWMKGFKIFSYLFLVEVAAYLLSHNSMKIKSEYIAEMYNYQK